MKVLNDGFITLVDHMGDDDSIVRAARVSHAANMKTGEDPAGDFRLVDYLYRNGHTSPFEHPVFTFHVKAPLFVFRQWHRHRTWSYNEISARYTELPQEYYVPAVGDIGVQSSTNHQARVTSDVIDNGVFVQESRIRDVIDANCSAAFASYRFLLEMGTPRELARTVLPLATYSEMYATVDLHNLLKFISERTAPGAQYEIRVYAEAMLELIEPHVPAAIAAWRAHRSTK